MTLAEAVRDEELRGRIIDDCCKLVDDEVAGKKGLSGAVIKTGYKAVKGIKPGFTRKVVNVLFDDWVAALEPIWTEAQQQGIAPEQHFEAERSRVAEALLSVTDAKSESAEKALVRNTYKKLRPNAKRHVEDAVPGLAALLHKHTG